ncbi:MAG TPA: SWIM zinc finger family protein, partial [Polyangiaceae bacterium]|nr:SWIM zinc finger family protein [Polyangiaceae bacterium]
MEFTYAYRGQSAVRSGPYRTQMSFVPDASRPPTYFSGEIGRALAFREAVSALHEVVVSDLRTKPTDKTAYKAWAELRDASDLERLAGRRADLAARCRALEAELREASARRASRWGHFYQARQRYFDHLYKHDRDFWYVLDPVVTVHPDEVFFECFSQDESSYGRLAVGYDSFKDRGEIACGTTNVDYSSKLYD